MPGAPEHGANNVEISGNNFTNIFGVASTGTLALKNISITHGHYDFDGGAVSSDGILSVSNSRFFNSTTSDWSGSAIFSTGPLIIAGSEFANNTGGGGAVKLRNSFSIATITGCSFHDNQSDGSAGGGYGGAMQILDGASVDIQNSTFSNNGGWFGAAIYVGANSTLTVNGSTLNGNATPVGVSGMGGAVRDDGMATTTNTRFSNNQLNTGGAIFVNSSATLTISSSTLTANVAASGLGGGISNHGSANIKACTFANNGATFGGGILSLSGSTLGLDSSTSTGNIAGLNGGGVFSDDTASVTNCTFSGNSTGGQGITNDAGGGLFVAGGGTVLQNVTFSGNASTLGGGIAVNGGTLTITNTLVEERKGWQLQRRFRRKLQSFGRWQLRVREWP